MVLRMRRSFFDNISAIKLLHLNVQCISNKLPQIDMLIDSSNIDIFLVSEHWQCFEYLKLCNVQNMSLAVAYCREKNKHGGVAIYLRNSKLFTFKNIDFLQDVSRMFEVECCGIVSDELKAIIIVIYRVPSSEFTAFLDVLNIVLEYVCRFNKCVIIGGDFNIDFLVPSNNLDRLKDLILSYDVNISIDQPTRVTPRSATCIDNFLVRGLHVEGLKVEVLKCHISDHYAQQLEFRTPISTSVNSVINKRLFSDKNISNFCALLEAESWYSITNEHNVNIAYDNFNAIISEHFQNCFPLTDILRKSVRNK